MNSKYYLKKEKGLKEIHSPQHCCTEKVNFKIKPNQSANTIQNEGQWDYRHF
jgi:hypothetical protein